MLLKVNGKEIFVKFTYERNLGKTICQISVGEKVLGLGYAICSKKDNFSYKNGRKVALNKAIPLNFNKEERGEFWKAYWTKRKEQTGKDWAV